MWLQRQQRFTNSAKIFYNTLFMCRYTNMGMQVGPEIKIKLEFTDDAKKGDSGRYDNCLNDQT